MAKRSPTSRKARPPAALAAYRAKRDFVKTAEPPPQKSLTRRKQAGGPIFVIQKHAASRLHYDFRLEVAGVLKSWAVPKEPTLDPATKRLAVQVEDHPLDYANFEGDIPAGQYGGGHVDIWDRGTYENVKAQYGQSMEHCLDEGRVEIDLHGDRLRGRFALVRTAMRGQKPNWLLMKVKDGPKEKSPATASPARAAKAKSRPSSRARLSAVGKVKVIGGQGADNAEVAFSNLDKVMFPRSGYTKGDLLKYYLRIAPKLLPHLRDRPITLERLPDGIAEGGPRFWQKNTPAYYPKWIPRVRLPGGDGKFVDYALVNDEQTLAYLVNQGAITFHVWFSRVADLNRPDYVLFDLDRSDATFANVVKVARLLHEMLDAEGTPHFVKTTGKSGLHILAPWRQAGDYPEARAWAEEVARRLCAKAPALATTHRMKNRRGARVYVDVVQNAIGYHAVPPYVVRPTEGATVSTPLEWKEVNARLNPAKFDLEVAAKRFAKRRVEPLLGLVGDE